MSARIALAALSSAALAVAGCGDVPCSHTRCGADCIDTASDQRNCGACGKACDPGLTCTAGSCQLVCPAGQSACDGACQSLMVDRGHCGACATACPAGEVCSAGRCAVSCQAGLTDCGGGCVDLTSDRSHCGACATACPGGSVCSLSRCAVSCQAGLTDCAGSCTNTALDPANCGACGKGCLLPSASPACLAGACVVASCAAGRADCNGVAADGCEVKLADDVANCGACNRACAPFGGDPACVDGECGLAACLPGFADCNQSAGDGCEVAVGADPANCGGCGSKCSVPNAVAGCSAGACTVAACSGPYLDCNAKAGDGCEVNGNSDASNCGACGKAGLAAANSTASCVGGACRATCNANFGDCDGNGANGCETDLRADAGNCGACGHACGGGGATCNAGVCAQSPGCHGPLVVTQTLPLDQNLFTAKHNNFHPQGITYDAAYDQIVFALQATRTAVWVDTAGVVQGSFQLPPLGMNAMDFTTGLAIDGSYLFIADYYNNDKGPDLVRYSRTGHFTFANGGTPSVEVAAFGGYPIALGGGLLFRTNPSIQYDWSWLDQVRVSLEGTPDVILRTLNINPNNRGIGGLAWDGSALWVLGYSWEKVPNRAIDLIRYDATTGAQLEKTNAVLILPSPLRPAGVAYGGNSLWVFGYSESQGTASNLYRIACK